MDHRHRPDGPPGDESAGWVVAGEEGRWPPSQRNGRADPGRARSGSAPPPQWYAPDAPGSGGPRYGGPGTAGYPGPDYPTGPPGGYASEPTSGYPTGRPSGYPTSDYPTGPPGGYPEPSGPYRRAPAGYPPADRQPDPAYPADPTEPRDPGEPGYRRGPGAGRTRPPDPPQRPEGDRPGPAWLPVLLWTVGLFLLPVVLYLGWTLTLSGAVPAGCVDAAGAACPPPRTEAVRRLVDVLPGVAGALALALLVALGLRRITEDWRDITVGLAAAVIGAGLATLIGSTLG